MMDILRKRVKIADGGRTVIPAEFRSRMNRNEGGGLVLLLDGGELRLFTPKHGTRRAQEMVSRYIPDDQSLSDGLKAERQAAARNEYNPVFDASG